MNAEPLINERWFSPIDGERFTVVRVRGATVEVYRCRCSTSWPELDAVPLRWFSDGTLRKVGDRDER